jgi:hypothetical protein
VFSLTDQTAAMPTPIVTDTTTMDPPPDANVRLSTQQQKRKKKKEKNKQPPTFSLLAEITIPHLQHPLTNTSSWI